jgi:hypothetical protein
LKEIINSTNKKKSPKLKLKGAKPSISQFSFGDDLMNGPGIIPSLNLKDDINCDFLNVKDNHSLISSNGKDFINKKRKNLSKIYQNILDKNINKLSESECNREGKNKTPPKKDYQCANYQVKEEKENMKGNYFSTNE